jgi:HEAT repeat protein
VNAADSPVIEVRVEVAIALGYIRDPNGLDALLKMTYDSDDFVRYEAAWALGHLADDRALPRLTEMARGDDPSSSSAASALEKFEEQFEDEEITDENIPKPHRVRLIVSNKANWDRLVERNMRRSFRSNRNRRRTDRRPTTED